MSVSLEKEGDISIIHIHEKFIDALNAPSIKSEIQSLFTANMHAILDLGQVEFLDSSGMGAILASMRHLNSIDGQLKLAGVSKPVQTLFELVRFNRILEIYPTIDEAIKAYQKVNQ